MHRQHMLPRIDNGFLHIYVHSGLGFWYMICLAASADESFNSANNELRELPSVEMSTLPLLLKVRINFETFSKFHLCVQTSISFFVLLVSSILYLIDLFFYCRPCWNVA